jgi:hypothetical protein
MPASTCARSTRCDVAISQSSLKWEWLLSNPQMAAPHTCSKFQTTETIPTGSALHVAAHSNNRTATKILLSHGADVDSLNDDRKTPLHIAAEEGHSEIVSVLLDHGANQCSRTKFGRSTPEMLASLEGHIECLEILTNLKEASSHKNRWDEHLFISRRQKAQRQCHCFLGRDLVLMRRTTMGIRPSATDFLSQRTTPLFDHCYVIGTWISTVSQSCYPQSLGSPPLSS